MVYAAKLFRPPIRMLGLARCLRDTGQNGNVGRQTHCARSVKLYFYKGETARYELLIVGKHVNLYELGFCSRNSFNAPYLYEEAFFSWQQRFALRARASHYCKAVG